MVLRAHAPHAELETGHCFSLEEPFFPRLQQFQVPFGSKYPKGAYFHLEDGPCPLDKEVGHQGGAGHALLHAGQDAASLEAGSSINWEVCGGHLPTPHPRAGFPAPARGRELLTLMTIMSLLTSKKQSWRSPIS